MTKFYSLPIIGQHLHYHPYSETKGNKNPLQSTNKPTIRSEKNQI